MPGYIVIRRSVVCLVIAGFLSSGCNPLAEGQFRRFGAGPDLFRSDMAERSAGLASYLRELCRQVEGGDAATLGGEVHGATCIRDEERKLVVSAGLNDIDARCDSYIDWLEEKRAERLFANQATSALTALLGGVLVGARSTEALAYVALALGFTSTLYNSYYDTVLLGMETSTIKTVLRERRQRFREAFQAVSYTSQPAVVYTLRAYMRICTPASITTDVNTFTRDAVLGVGGNPAVSRAAAERDVVPGYKAPTAGSAAVPPRRAPLTLSTELKRIFASPGFEIPERDRMQDAFCVPRGRVDDRTIANMNLALREPEANALVDKGRITDDEYRDITRKTGGVPCDKSRYQNVYENERYRSGPGDEAVFVSAVLQLLAKPPAGAPAAESGTQAGSLAAARTAIRQVRDLCGLGNSGPFAGQVTGELERAVADPDKFCRRTGGPTP